MWSGGSKRWRDCECEYNPVLAEHRPLTLPYVSQKPDLHDHLYALRKDMHAQTGHAELGRCH